MKIAFSVLCVAFVMTAASVTGVLAQDRVLSSAAGDRYVISAKPGGVNYVVGSVGIVRAQGPNGRLLKGERVEIGDRVSTGPDGRVEILLNPGSYVRIGGDSAFQFKSTSLDDLQIGLDRGSAVLEVFAADDFVVTLKAPKAKFRLINSGVFRLDVSPSGAGTLSVWKGRAKVGTSTAGLIKSGQIMNVSGTQVSLGKLDRAKMDDLDVWSKSRGKELAKLTDSLQKRELRNALLNAYAGNQWNMYGSFGLWVMDRFTGMYCFVPFGYGWSSPYGYGLDHNIGWYDLPWTVYRTPTWTPSSPPYPGQPSGPTVTPIPSQGDRSPIPPFVRMSGESGRGNIGNGRRGVDGGEYTPPIYSPRETSPAPSAPTKMDIPSAPEPRGKKGER